MDEILASLLGLIVRQTGRAVVWLVSFGHWRGEQLLAEESRVYGAAGALWYFRDGKRVITDRGLLFFGIAFYVALLVALIANAA